LRLDGENSTDAAAAAAAAAMLTNHHHFPSLTVFTARWYSQDGLSDD